MTSERRPTEEQRAAIEATGLEALVEAVQTADDPSQFSRYLRSLGKDHRKFHVSPEHYGTVGTALIEALRAYAGSWWSIASAGASTGSRSAANQPPSITGEAARCAFRTSITTSSGNRVAIAGGVPGASAIPDAVSCIAYCTLASTHRADDRSGSRTTKAVGAVENG